MPKSMQRHKSGLQIINKDLIATPLEAHGYRIQPTAKITGWQAATPAISPDKEAAQPFMGGSAFLRVCPTVVQVEHAGQAAYQVPLIDPTQPVLHRLLWIAAVTAAVAGLANWVIRQRYR